MVHPSRRRYSTALSGLNSLVYSGAAVSCKSAVQAVREKFENFVVRIRRERGSQREGDREDSRAKNWRTSGKKPLSIRLEFTRGKCSWNSPLRWSTILTQGFVRNLVEAVSLLRLRVVADAKIETGTLLIPCYGNLRQCRRHDELQRRTSPDSMRISRLLIPVGRCATNNFPRRLFG